MGSNYAREHSSNLELQINLPSSCRATGVPACAASEDTGRYTYIFFPISRLSGCTKKWQAGDNFRKFSTRSLMLQIWAFRCKKGEMSSLRWTDSRARHTSRRKQFTYLHFPLGARTESEKAGRDEGVCLRARVGTWEESARDGDSEREVCEEASVSKRVS